MRKTYRITIEPASDAIDLFWSGFALGVVTYVVVAVAYWYVATYLEETFSE